MTAASPERMKVRVTRLKIEKFRAIGAAEIELGSTVALVGQNGAGKSSVLRALNAFFNFDSERQAFEAGWHRYSTSTQSIIEVTIAGLPPETLLPIVVGTGEFRGRLKYQRKPIWQVWKGGKWETVPSFQDTLRQHIT
ncbi:AAA family ATPase [Lapillicoccus jejuensis]|uniref:AAA family ATPase n=1 Tax=Lapillicoccus jejuensis TaxID=402171 RepID=UPI0011518449|nr:AAA family ATPase [Lapillicoccus jejuensis]